MDRSELKHGLNSLTRCNHDQRICAAIRCVRDGAFIVYNTSDHNGPTVEVSRSDLVTFFAQITHDVPIFNFSGAVQLEKSTNGDSKLYRTDDPSNVVHFNTDETTRFIEYIRTGQFDELFGVDFTGEIVAVAIKVTAA